jgi:hypothetical protein
VTILLWIAAVSLSAKAMYESARGFMHEFLEHGLYWGTTIQYTALFMLSTAILMVNFM